MSKLTDKYGEDNYENADVVTYIKRYGSNGPNYDYAAIKAGDYWYTTGGDKLTWEHLLSEINRDNIYAFNLWRATGWEELSV